MIVLDTCAATGIVRKTPEGQALVQLMLDGEKVISHDFFPVEVGNVFWKHAHAHNITSDEALKLTTEATNLVDEIYPTSDFLHEALREAIRLDHSIYDLLYFVLARREGATVFTLDQKLQKLCLDNGVNCVYTNTKFQGSTLAE